MGYSGIKIDMTKDADVEIKTPVKQKTEDSPEATRRDRDLSLCFWLGMLLPIYGLIISAIILKGDGVRMALSGMIRLAILVLCSGIITLIFLAFKNTPSYY